MLGKDVTAGAAVAEEAIVPVIVLPSVGSLDCMGRPISVAELALLILLPECVALLNMCGIRALARVDEELPSGGCTC